MAHSAVDLEEIKMNIGGLSLLGKLRITRASDPVEMQDHEDQFELLYMHSGQKIFYVGKEKYVLNGGDVLLVFPGEIHGAEDITQNRTMLYYLLFYDPVLFPGFCDLSDYERGELSRILRKIDNRHIPVSAQLKKSFDELFSLIKGQCPIREARIKHFALETIWQVIRSSQNISYAVPDDIRTVKDYIHQNYYEMPSVTDLAMMVHLSVPRFKQKFKQVTGIPPAEYIIRHKVGLAEQQLKKSDKSITAIAFDLGFSSSQHFSVVFKKYNGQSPLNFRRSS